MGIIYGALSYTFEALVSDPHMENHSIVGLLERITICMIIGLLIGLLFSIISVISANIYFVLVWGMRIGVAAVTEGMVAFVSYAILWFFSSIMDVLFNTTNSNRFNVDDMLNSFILGTVMGVVFFPFMEFVIMSIVAEFAPVWLKGLVGICFFSYGISIYLLNLKIEERLGETAEGKFISTLLEEFANRLMGSGLSFNSGSEIGQTALGEVPGYVENFYES